MSPLDHPKWENLTTIDINPDHHPDIKWDLNNVPWPLASNTFDECHAYQVLEHLGRQGDAAGFFGLFDEIWRVLKPRGILMAHVPMWDNLWAWGDPGHTRIINRGTLQFLDKDTYVDVGLTAQSDYRGIYQGNFRCTFYKEHEGVAAFCLEARK
jgi:SAM-dependent methyltransferase